MTSALMAAAAINETLGYVLFTTGNPGTSFQPYLPITLIGAVPFLVTAALILLALRGARKGTAADTQDSVHQIRVVSGFGLPLIVVGGLWSGLGLGFLGIDANAPAAVALFIYQFTFLAAVIADVALLIVAFRVKSGQAG